MSLEVRGCQPVCKEDSAKSSLVLEEHPLDPEESVSRQDCWSPGRTSFAGSLSIGWRF